MWGAADTFAAAARASAITVTVGTTGAGSAHLASPVGAAKGRVGFAKVATHLVEEVVKVMVVLAAIVSLLLPGVNCNRGLALRERKHAQKYGVGRRKTKCVGAAWV